MSLFTYLKRGVRYVLKGIPNKIVVPNITYLNPSEILKGKKIIITGGGRGLGYAMAKRFVSEGASVLIAGRNENVLAKSAKEIGCFYSILDVQNVNTFN
ncbi:MAG: SDR family NAD(P)-dependent oxidoreductase, partial [Paludibacteraceae bacterium]|nr:SDR family NAD(P)-dependent oxidoreductase [Paludibacteraceae bacterium]